MLQLTNSFMATDPLTNPNQGSDCSWPVHTGPQNASARWMILLGYGWCLGKKPREFPTSQWLNSGVKPPSISISTSIFTSETSQISSLSAASSASHPKVAMVETTCNPVTTSEEPQSQDGRWTPGLQPMGTDNELGHPYTLGPRGTSKMQAKFQEALPPTIYTSATFCKAM